MFISKVSLWFLLLGEKAVTPVQFKGVDTDLASKFVFSPPVLRSRKKQVSSISRIVEDLVSNLIISSVYIQMFLYFMYSRQS